MSINLELEKTYVYDGVEVKKTGRVAEKVHYRRSPTAYALKQNVIQMIEITPVDVSYVWTKWVRPEDLFTVINNNGE